MDTSREQLVRVARRNVEHLQAGTVDQADGIYRVPTSNYWEPQRWGQEMDRIFRRLPLVLGFSTELAEPGSYRATEVAGMPVLLVRGEDGAMRAFVNMCAHRGAIVAPEGTGRARRFSCPYHGWTYHTNGDLDAVYCQEMFGEVSPEGNGLTPLPVAERAGLIWVTLNPGSTVDMDAFLGGYDDLLAHLGFESCHVVGRQTIPGPNWKVAYDGYLDFYHLPILHRASFGPGMSPKATYDSWGPHQRVTAPDGRIAELAELPEAEWDSRHLVSGVWTIFPHVSIAAFDAGGKMYMVSTLFPGATPDESFTVQNFLHTQPADDEQPLVVDKVMKFLFGVVADEDYKTGLGIQRTVKTGAKATVMFGRNEVGGQRFHQWVDALLATSDADLNTRLATPLA